MFLKDDKMAVISQVETTFTRHCKSLGCYVIRMRVADTLPLSCRTLKTHQNTLRVLHVIKSSMPTVAFDLQDIFLPSRRHLQNWKYTTCCNTSGEAGHS